MKTLSLALAVSLLLGSSAIAQRAGAEPVTLSRTIVKDGFGKHGRYCDQASRCWTEGYRNLLLDSYATLPPPPWYRHTKLAVRSQPQPTKQAAQQVLRNAQARMR